MIKKSENRDGELPTEQSEREDKECGSRSLERLQVRWIKRNERDRRLGFKR